MHLVIARSFVALVAVLAGAPLVACSGSSTGTDGNGTSGGSGTGSSTGDTTPSPGHASTSSSSSSSSGSSTPADTGPACSVADDCPNWFCDCAQIGPVNSTDCVNDHCEDATVSCPKACAAFGSCWLGTAGGGFSGGKSSGKSTCN